MGIKVVYHIFAGADCILSTLQRQIGKLFVNGLVHKSESIFMCISGNNEENYKKALQYCQALPPPFTLYYTEFGDTSHEQMTLTRIPEFIQEKDMFLYIHTKGTSKKDKENKHVLNWLECLEYFIIEKHSLCIQFLELGLYEIVGALWRKSCEAYPQHFCGNMWWSTGKHYLETFQRYNHTLLNHFDNRANEYLIGYNSPRVKNLFEDNYECDWYGVSVEPSVFKASPIDLSELKEVSSVKVFYHIYATGSPEVISVIQNQISKLQTSSLTNIASGIYVCLSGNNQENYDKVASYIQSLPSPFILYKPEFGDTTWEKFTFRRMIEIIQPEDKVLYMHSKGTNNRNPNIESWVECMLYFLCDHHTFCINALDTHDIVGAIWREQCNTTPPHFSGNFWWTRGDYFLDTYSKFKDTLVDRWSDEFLITRNSPRVKVLFDDKQTDWYHRNISPEEFKLPKYFPH
jgi:hypothetical protein